MLRWLQQRRSVVDALVKAQLMAMTPLSLDNQGKIVSHCLLRSHRVTVTCLFCEKDQRVVISNVEVWALEDYPAGSVGSRGTGSPMIRLGTVWNFPQWTGRRARGSKPPIVDFMNLDSNAELELCQRIGGFSVEQHLAAGINILHFLNRGLTSADIRDPLDLFREGGAALPFR